MHPISEFVSGYRNFRITVRKLILTAVVITYIGFFSFRSVFFRGQVERRLSVFSTILGHSDLPVRVAVNRERLVVFDDEKNVSV